MKARLIAAVILLGIISSVFAARVPLADIQARKNYKDGLSLMMESILFLNSSISIGFIKDPSVMLM